MKKFNSSKKHKSDNSGFDNIANNKKEIFNKLNKIEIKPKFLVIGLIAIVIVISLIYFIFLKYSPIMNFKYEGYGISGKQITENLLGASSSSENSQGSNLGEEKNVNLTKIEEQGTIFKKLNSYFIGSKEKTEIDLNYPIYINDKNTIYNLNQDIALISKNFEQVAGYPNISITDGKVYNGNGLERADSKEYIFAKTKEGIYINLKEIKIETTANEYILPTNSLIVFEEDTIRYYSVSSNIVVFNEIKDVDYNSQVVIKNVEENSLGTNEQNTQNIQNTLNNQVAQSIPNVQKVDKEYNYEELLTKLGVIESAKNDVEKEEIIEEDTSDDKKENNTENETDPNAPQDPKPENNEQANAEYIKPEVTVEDFKAEVYTVKSNLNIKDPKARIIEAPTFEIYKDEKIYLRRVFKNSGEIQITGLVPETEYEIIGKYIYLNAENKKIENTFYKGTIKTKGYEALGTIEINKEEGEIYSNKIQIKNVKIISDLQNEAIKGINQIELETGNIKTVLKNNKVNELLEGKEVTIESSEGLKSNTNIEYVIKFYDKNGKELKVKNNKGKTRTSKQEPKVTVKIKEQDIVSVTLGLKLTNKDNVKLENYKYIITRPNGEKLKEERLSEHEKEIKLEDLDQNQYYKIKVYADYDLGDNKGIQKDVEIGNLVFATKPISTLGSLEMIVENKELTSKNAKISYKIDEDKTDKRLIQILNELTIKIVETPQDSEGNVNEEENNDETVSKEHKDKKVVYTNTLTKEETEKLQLGETKEINYENLKSNTKYTIEITGNVELGNTKEEVPVTYIYKEFTTLKIPAKVEIKNQFVTGNLIDLDVRVEDEDNSVLNNKVRMELRDEKSNLIDLQEIETNKDWLRKTYEKLEENKTYKLSFYADQYNEGSTDKTYKINYLIKEIEIVTEPGISGSVGLTELTKKATGKNLVDISSEIKWYVYPNFYTNDYYGKEYNEETEILTLGGHGNYRRAVYDLREYAGQEVTMSFKAKAVSGSQTAYIQNSKIDKNRILIQNLTEEWNDYKYTLVVDNTGYLGFYIEGGNGIEVKELQIELGNKKTNYEEFKYNLQSNYSINLEDKRDEITTNDYYIKIYEDNNLVQTNRYEEIPEENVITNAIKTYEVQAGRQYKVELTIKMKEREYVLSKLEYNTQETEEIKGIYTKEDFFEIQQRGNYILLNDLNLKETKYFGGANFGFNGKINFNGKNVDIVFSSTDNKLFHKIEDKAVIKNLVLNLHLPDKDNGFYAYGSIAQLNYGLLKDIQINIVEAYNRAYSDIRGIMIWQNYGKIDGLIVNYKETLYGYAGASLIDENRGIVKNGYIYGKNIIMHSKSQKGYGQTPLIRSNSEGSIIENIFILNSTNTFNNEIGANFTIKNAGTIKNVYSVDLNKDSTVTQGPNVWSSYGTIENSYYFSDKIFNNTKDIKASEFALYDIEFQNKIINSENRFNVASLIKQGYFPWLNFENCMPKQQFIKLPELKDEDLADVISVEILEKNNDSAKVKFFINNENSENILDIKINNLNCKIISQKHNNGKSEVEAIINQPVRYVSEYEIISLTTQGVLGKEYTRKYNKDERKINIEFYKEINNIADWEQINKIPTENYILNKDLDFINQSENVIITSVFKGKLDGNNHVIKNVTVPENSRGVFSDIYGSIKNLTIENYNQKIKSNNTIYGFIGNGNYGAILENVHIKNATITKENESGLILGILIGKGSNVKVKNCSVTDSKINFIEFVENITVGSIIGECSDSSIENTFVQDVEINVCNALNINGIGGIVGKINYSKIENCYSTGSIHANKGYIGGIAGDNNNIILKSFSNMNIETISGVAGGIVGKNEFNPGDTTGGIPVKYNLYLGNLYTKTNIANRISGNGNMGIENYGYINQKIVGEEEKIKLLNDKELFNKNTYISTLLWGENYDYSDLSKNILPKLKNNVTKEVIPNQKDIKIEEEIFSIRSIETRKDDNYLAEIRIEINNPNNLDITKLEIDGLDINITKNKTEAGITYIDMKVKPIRYWDNYKISKICYNENNVEKKVDIMSKIDLQFFKDINNYADWQDINAESAENYNLMTDLDFTGKKVKTNLSIGRLKGNNHTISNINVNMSNSGGIIKEITARIEEITIKDINITNETTGSYIGVVGNLSGEMENIKFENVIINAPKRDFVACIASTTSKKINNIELNNVKVTGKNYIGGLLTKTDENEKTNIKAEKLEIKGEGDFVGGVAGYIPWANYNTETKVSNLVVKDSKISGYKYVGGIIGYGKIKNMESINNHVVGIDCVGGISGNTFQTHGKVAVEDSIIEGTGNYIGGIAGFSNAVRKVRVNNTEVYGGSYTGGIVGYAYRVYNSKIENSEILSTGNIIGGIVGHGRSRMFSCY